MRCENLYFLHKIIPTLKDGTGEKLAFNEYQLALTKIENDDIYSDNNELFTLEYYNPSAYHSDKHVEYSRRKADIYEGCFVSRCEDDYWENANNNPVARSLILKSNILRSKLKKYVASPDTEADGRVTEAFSYHVNVGHGNASIVIYKKNNKNHIWLVDCSDYDFPVHKSYRSNLQKCFSYIKNKFGLREIRIEKFLITHMHYDHISAAENIIDNGLLEAGAEIWLNEKCSHSSKMCSRIQDKIIKLCSVDGKCNFKIIEPIAMNSMDAIRVLYPEISITGTRVGTHVRAPGGNFNNSSVVYYIHLGDKSMVFPGDIEADGWNLVESCIPYMQQATYYCLSHHGSITGHRRERCPVEYEIKDICRCCSNVQKAILMGRDGAYRGIFSPEVLKDFSGRLYITEKAKHFIELDWKTGICHYL